MTAKNALGVWDGLEIEIKLAVLRAQVKTLTAERDELRVKLEVDTNPGERAYQITVHVEAEREACAKAADALGATLIADAIRARKS